MIKAGPYSQDNYSFLFIPLFSRIIKCSYLCPNHGYHFKHSYVLYLKSLPMRSLNLCKDGLLALVANIIADKRLVYSEKISLTVDAS